MHAALPADAAHQALQAGGPHEVGTSTSNFDLDSLSAKTEVFSNFFARVIQHEYDHLNGILFTDYIIKDKEDLFFDNGHKLINIPQPKKLVTW